MNETPPISSLFDNQIKYVPLFLAAISFLSYSSLHYYYREFGITIYEYLTTSELLLLFLPSLHSLIVLLIWSVIIFSITLAAFPPRNFDEPEDDEDTRTVWEYLTYLRSTFVKKIGVRKTLGILKRVIVRLWPLFTIILLLTFLERGEQSGWIEGCTENVQDDMVLILFGLVLLIIAITIFRTRFTQIVQRVILICLFTYGVLWMIKHRNVCQTDKIKSGERFQEVSMVMDGKVFATSQDTVYVGSVQKYTFLYILSHERTLVIPKDNTKLIEIGEK